MARATGMSDALVQLLAAADQRNGLPKGTMYSVLQQESGGQERFLQDPSTYHYGLNADGKRIAGHTGKVSTAFGPFGILESTAAQPGYGVAPLKDKSLEEQLRFASEYLAARSRHGGGLQQGLAGYGEGARYAQQVAGRLPAESAMAPMPAAVTPLSSTAPMGVAAVAPPAVPGATGPVAPLGPDPWQAFHAMVQARRTAPIQPEQLDYRTPRPMTVAPAMVAQAPMRRPLPEFGGGNWADGWASLSDWAPV